MFIHITFSITMYSTALLALVCFVAATGVFSQKDGTETIFAKCSPAKAAVTLKGSKLESAEVFAIDDSAGSRSKRECDGDPDTNCCHDESFCAIPTNIQDYCCGGTVSGGPCVTWVEIDGCGECIETMYNWEPVSYWCPESCEVCGLHNCGAELEDFP